MGGCLSTNIVYITTQEQLGEILPFIENEIIRMVHDEENYYSTNLRSENCWVFDMRQYKNQEELPKRYKGKLVHICGRILLYLIERYTTKPYVVERWKFKDTIIFKLNWVKIGLGKTPNNRVECNISATPVVT